MTAIWIEGTDLIVLQTFFKLVYKKSGKVCFFFSMTSHSHSKLSNTPKQAIFKIAFSL